MELSNLTHKLIIGDSVTYIEEPIGFDDFKVKFKRHDYHGMTVEVSEQSLGFYKEGADAIKMAYETNIDKKVEYVVESGFEVLYNGIVDLSTMQEKLGKYHCISCKVGEAGPKTTFNNRASTDVDLNTTKTIDGGDLEMQAVWSKLRIPEKRLIYTNYIGRSKNESFTKDANQTNIIIGTTTYGNITIPFNNIKNNEYGDVSESDLYILTDQQISAAQRVFYISDKNEFIKRFGNETKHEIVAHVHCRLELDSPYSKSTKVTWASEVRLYKADGEYYTMMYDDLEIDLDEGETAIEIDREFTFRNTKTISTEYEIVPSVKFRVATPAASDFPDKPVTITFYSDTNIRTKMEDNVLVFPVDADMIKIHEAMNVIVGAISENDLSVKSDYYGRIDSRWNPIADDGLGGVGRGSLKAITNGYKIRDLYTDGVKERNMPISFKKIIQSLDAIDCIGWGFSNEDGVDYVRVEPWEWFYHDMLSIEINDANEVTIDVDAENIITELKVGYKKYENVDDFNSIDSVHGERVMTNQIKSISNSKSVECEFIADTYCIEETRRARENEDETKSFKYDEDIFIFELSGKTYTIPSPQGDRRVIEYSIPNNIKAEGVVGINNPNDQYNMAISPRRCIERWAARLFNTSNISAYRTTSGTINYKAEFACNVNHWEGIRYISFLDDPFHGEVTSESKDIVHSIINNSKVIANTISFQYPITFSQYKRIKEHPYWKIRVNGMEGWIKEFSYSIRSGMATFKLIAARTTTIFDTDM